MVRPPWVVNAPNSSPMERSHSFLPSFERATQGRADSEGVDIAGFGIDGGGGPAYAVGGGVALKDVEFVFPDHLAGVGIEAHDALLLVSSAAGGVLHVQVIAHEDRSGAAAEGGSPEEVFTFEGPLFGQAFLLGDAVAIGAALVGPVA